MLSPQALFKGIVSRVRPAVPNVDNANLDVTTRMGPFGDLKVESAWPTKHLLADEGCYFSFQPAIGTALNLYAAAGGTSYSSIAAVLGFYNSDQLVGNGGTGKNIYLDFIKLFVDGTAPASTTTVQWAVTWDNVSRLPTANASAPQTPLNVNGNSSVKSITQLYYCNANGGMTLPSVGPNFRQIDHGIWGGAAPIIAGDSTELIFGSGDPTGANGPLTAARAGANAKFIDNCSPLVIGPQQWGFLHVWGPASATNAWQYEFAVGLIER